MRVRARPAMMMIAQHRAYKTPSRLKVTNYINLLFSLRSNKILCFLLYIVLFFLRIIQIRISCARLLYGQIVGKEQVLCIKFVGVLDDAWYIQQGLSAIGES